MVDASSVAGGALLPVAGSCVAVAAGHTVLGLALKWALRSRPDLKGWPLWTYWHSIVHTALVLPCLLAYCLLNTKLVAGQTSFVAWLEQPWTHGPGLLSAEQWCLLGPGLRAEQWVQSANVGFVISVTLLSLRKVLASPSLLLHHLVTIAGCVAWLHGAHGAGYGALFTIWSELGSTMHNLMVMWNCGATRWARVVTDVVSRGGATVLLLMDAPLARARGLPLYLQVWTFAGGAMWLYLNFCWTKHVFVSLVRGKQQPQQQPQPQPQQQQQQPTMPPTPAAAAAERAEPRAKKAAKQA